MADKAEVFLGRKDRYNSPEPWGKYVWGRWYVCGAIYQGKVIYNHGRSPVLEALKDSASDVFGRLSWHRCLEYDLKNGFMIDDDGKVVTCEPCSPEEEAIFVGTLEGRIKEKRERGL